MSGDVKSNTTTNGSRHDLSRSPSRTKQEELKSASRKQSLSRSLSRSRQEMNKSTISTNNSATNSPRPSAKKEVPKDEKQEYAELPKLPVPLLSLTMAQYLDNLRPILSEESMLLSQVAVQDFIKPGGVGELAHKHLLEKSEQEDNWAYNYWLKDMYIGVDLPLPINSNPGMVFPRQNFRTIEDMLVWTSRVSQQICKYKQRLDKMYVPQDKAASREPGQPLCMAQYFRLLTSYRRPGIETDLIMSSGEIEKTDEHMVVMRRGNIFAIPLKKSGVWRKLEDVYASLVDVWTESATYLPLTHRVAVLSANNRRVWGQQYNQLEAADPINKASLASIAEAMFIVCLDDETQNQSDLHRSLKDMFRQMLTGAGSRFNGTNRWFDKTVQLVVTPDGVCGLCYEHSVSEGIVPVQMFQDILQNIEDSGTNSIAYHPNSSEFTKLEWNIVPTISENIVQAIQVLDELDMSNDLEVFRFREFGREFIKSCRCSPDAWLQLSLQLTKYRLDGCIVPTYESASTRRFRLGRVDSIRASHPEALAWCQSMLSDVSKEEKRKKFDTAIKKQTKVMVDNILGLGLDIPLLGLREATKQLGLWDKQNVFKDQAYERLNQFLLSTSQVPVGLDPSFMGYGAVVPDGYGVSYNPYPSSIIFCICSFHSSEVTNSREFANQLQISLTDMQALFVKPNLRK